MYAEAELKHVQTALKLLAAAHGVPEEEIRAEITAAMQTGRNDPNPIVQERWASAPNDLEATLLWIGEQVKK